MLTDDDEEEIRPTLLRFFNFLSVLLVLGDDEHDENESLRFTGWLFLGLSTVSGTIIGLSCSSS